MTNKIVVDIYQYKLDQVEEFDDILEYRDKWFEDEYISVSSLEVKDTPETPVTSIPIPMILEMSLVSFNEQCEENGERKCKPGDIFSLTLYNDGKQNKLSFAIFNNNFQRIDLTCH